MDIATAGGDRHALRSTNTCSSSIPLYLILITATLVISGGAQLYIRSTYGEWDRVPNQAVLNGAQVAEVLRERARSGNGSGQQAITAIRVVEGQLSDHFDPRDRSRRSPRAVATRPSVASMAISAHEVGHAVQVAEGGAWMQLRSVLVPAASIGPQFAYLFILGGLFFNLTGLFTLGILIFGIAVLFMLLTLPVEIQQAGRRSRCWTRPASSRRRRNVRARGRCSRPRP